MSNSNPSIDPALEGTLSGSLSFAFSKLMQANNGMLPAKVIAFDRTKNRAQVQPMIAIVTTDGTIQSRAQYATLPVLILGAGGFMLNFNLQPGDLGWIFANDRDISGFLQTYAESSPNTTRMNSFSDALFIPDVMRGYTIDGEDASNAVLQSLDGTVKISLSTSKIKLKAPTIELEGSVVIDNDVTVNGAFTATDGATISGGGVNSLTVTGDLRTIGNITASGSITPFVP